MLSPQRTCTKPPGGWKVTCGEALNRLWPEPVSQTRPVKAERNGRLVFMSTCCRCNCACQTELRVESSQSACSGALLQSVYKRWTQLLLKSLKPALCVMTSRRRLLCSADLKQRSVIGYETPRRSRVRLSCAVNRSAAGFQFLFMGPGLSCWTVCGRPGPRRRRGGKSWRSSRTSFIDRPGGEHKLY